MHKSIPHSKAARAFIPAFIALGALAILFLLLPVFPVYAVSTTRVFDTIADFNQGTFFHTGLTEDTISGGDGDGEIRLLNVGINPATWIQNVSVTGLPPRWGHAAVHVNGRIYVSGGNTSLNSNTARSDVRFTTINANHSLSAFTNTTALPSARWLHSMVALNGYVYVIGGLDLAAVQRDTVYKAKINPDGSLGSWTTTAALPQPLSDLGALVIGNRIYVIGGDNAGLISNKVYMAIPDGSGNIGGWATETDFPRVISRHAVATTSGRAYVAGGADFPNTDFYPYAYYGQPNGSGDIPWTQTESMPVNIVYAAGVAYASQLYIVGGAFNQGSSLENNIRSNFINPTGSLVINGWTSSPVLSSPRQRTAAVVSDYGWIYVIQGQDGLASGTALSSVDYGPTTAADATKFAPDGNYTSPVIDILGSYPVEKIRFVKNVSTGTAMTFQYRVSNDPTFTGVPFSTPVNATSGSADQTIVINQTGRYVQFLINFTANPDYTQSPVINQVDLTYDAPVTITPTATVTTTPGTVTPTPTACPGKPGKVTLVSPNNKSNLRVKKVPLAWNSVPCAVKYKVIVREGSPKGPRVFRKRTKNIQIKTTALKGGQYYWIVKACNPPHGCGKSGWWQFKTKK